MPVLFIEKHDYGSVNGVKIRVNLAQEWTLGEGVQLGHFTFRFSFLMPLHISFIGLYYRLGPRSN